MELPILTTDNIKDIDRISSRATPVVYLVLQWFVILDVLDGNQFDVNIFPMPIDSAVEWSFKVIYIARLSGCYVF